MKPLDTYINLIETKFPTYVPIDYDLNIGFKSDGALFKRDDNTYCFVELSNIHDITGSVFVSIFKSDESLFDRIDSDYLNFSSTFSFDSPEKFKYWIDAVM